MHDRLTRIETVAENQEKLISDTRADLRGIRSDMKSMENRIVDKMDENQKWLVGLLVSAILVPLFIALVTGSAAAGFVVSLPLLRLPHHLLMGIGI